METVPAEPDGKQIKAEFPGVHPGAGGLLIGGRRSVSRERGPAHVTRVHPTSGRVEFANSAANSASQSAANSASKSASKFASKSVTNSATKSVTKPTSA